MNKLSYPTEDALLKVFEPITDQLHSLLPTVAERRIRPYFSQDGLPVDRILASTMVRYAIKKHLNSCQLPDDLEFRPLSNHGIECVFRQFAFKILRADKDGEVPAPGKSRRRFRFYNNFLMDFQLPLGGTIDAEVRKRWLYPNVVLIWDYDGASKTLTLKLALPNRALTMRGPVDCIFTVDVPVPAGVVPAPVGGLAPIPTDDLDVQPANNPEAHEDAEVEDAHQGE